MYFLTTFLILTLLDQLNSQSVATTSMKDFLLLFDIFAVIIIDANIKFCEVFEEELQPLNTTIL